MRVALTTYALHIGGLETFVLFLAKGLGAAGHEVHIVATDAPGAWFHRPAEVGAQAHFIDGASRRSRVAHAKAVATFLTEAHFDAVINNFSWYTQASLGMLPEQTVTVSVIHNTAEPIISLSCANAAACQAFVAPSPATLALARARVVPAEKVRLIQHGVEIPDPPAPRNGGRQLSVVFCGRLEHVQKGILLLPEIVRQASESGVELRLEVIGEGPDRQELIRLLNEAGVSGQVDIVGALDHPDSLARLRKADALILPSFFEGLPFVVLEALSLGVVPIISCLPGITDWMVEDGSSGFLVPPGDVQGFKNALILLGRDPERRRTMSLAAWEAARSRFSAAQMVDSYHDLLYDLQSQNQRPRARPPALASDMVHWKDYIPPMLRHAGGLLLGPFRPRA